MKYIFELLEIKNKTSKVICHLIAVLIACLIAKFAFNISNVGLLIGGVVGFVFTYFVTPLPTENDWLEMQKQHCENCKEYIDKYENNY